MRRGVLALVASITLAAMSVSPVLASATKTSYNGLVVSPAIEQLTLGKDQSSASFNAEVTNDSAAAILVDVRTDDFTSLDNTGSVAFLNNSTHVATPHGLAHWLSPGLLQFNLNPGASQIVPVTIADASNLAPGGHYGAVIFKAIPNDVNAPSNLITANAEVSVLIFLTTYDSGMEAIKLIKPAFSSVHVAMPSVFDLVFTNTGNTQTVPRGLVVVTDDSNREIARGIINTDSGMVLPSTDRLYEVALKSERRIVWPGMYHVSVLYRAGDGTTYTAYVQSFFYVSQPVVAVFAAAFAVLTLVLIRKLGPRFIHYRSKRT